MKTITTPINRETLTSLTAGDYVYISGTIYTARDAAHKRMFNAVNCGSELPFCVNNQIIYYVGPCFDKFGKPISAGPTTGMRMDTFAPALYDAGLSVTIGKGDRSREVYDSIIKNKALYLAAIGGAGAIYANTVISCKTVAYEDLGTEAIYKLEVTDFPAIVAIDCNGNSIYN